MTCPRLSIRGGRPAQRCHSWPWATRLLGGAAFSPRVATTSSHGEATPGVSLLDSGVSFDFGLELPYRALDEHARSANWAHCSLKHPEYFLK